jgi:hypothetical protein
MKSPLVPAFRGYAIVVEIGVLIKGFSEETPPVR